MAEDIAVRLEGTGLRDGEITFGALSVITDAFQELATRIGRHLRSQPGVGRTAASAERATRLRLRGLATGSTRLVVTVGEDQPLPADEDLENRAVSLLWELFDAMNAEQPPAWVTPPLARSAVRVADALAATSTSCEIKSETRPRQAIHLIPAQVDRRAWDLADPAPAPIPEAHVSGVLDLVDLRSRRFRVRDDVGNDIVLEDVGDATEASRLVGSRVTAVGEAIPGRRGQIVKLVAARVSDGALPGGWQAAERAVDSLDVNLSPPPDGIVGVTDADVEAFLDMIRT